MNGACVACAPDDATYTVSRNITDINRYEECDNGDCAHSFYLFHSATVQLGSERYLIYGWPNSVGVFNITTPIQDTWEPLPIIGGSGQDNNPTQPLTIPTQLGIGHNPPGFLWIVNSSFASCAFGDNSHAFITEHMVGAATLDGFPYVYIDRSVGSDSFDEWGWDLLDIRPPVHFVHAGSDPACLQTRDTTGACGGLFCYEIISAHGGGPGVLFRSQGSVYLAQWQSIYLLSAADGSVTPETFKAKTAVPVGTLPTALDQSSSFTQNSVYAHDGQQFLLMSSDLERNITVINITIPSSPSLVTVWSPHDGYASTDPGSDRGFAVDPARNILYRISQNGLIVYAYNISTLRNPVLLSETTWADSTLGGTLGMSRAKLSLTGDLLVASESNRTGFLNIKDPSHPTVLRGQPGVTSLSSLPFCSGHYPPPSYDGSCTFHVGESSGCDVLAFQQGGGYYATCGRGNEGYITKVDSCTLS